MKALSLKQPWATLIAVGAKHIETRSWSTTYRGPLAIHASKSISLAEASLCCEEAFRGALETGSYWFDGTYKRNPFRLPLSAVIAIAMLVDVRQITTSNIPGEPERSFGAYAPGRYAWMLCDILSLLEPFPARGSLGLWEWMPPSGFFLLR